MNAKYAPGPPMTLGNMRGGAARSASPGRHADVSEQLQRNKAPQCRRCGLSLLPLRQFGVRLEARGVKNMDKEAHYGADGEGDGG